MHWFIFCQEMHDMQREVNKLLLHTDTVAGSQIDSSQNCNLQENIMYLLDIVHKISLFTQCMFGVRYIGGH